MTNYICELSGKAYLERMKENPTVIIPTGACEIYGQHLPIGTDILVAKKLSEILAEKLGALIAPTIECGESSGLKAFECTFPMPRQILEDYIDFLVGKLINDGAKNIIFITGHAGNVSVVNYVCNKYLDCGVKFCQVDMWRATIAVSDGLLDYPGGHAAELGTSVVMYLFPELVDMDSYVGSEPPKNDYPLIITYATFKEKTPNGCIGYAINPTPEKGKAIVDATIDKILEYVNNEMK